MAQDQLEKYIWLIDTLRRGGRMTRDEINDRIEVSSLNDRRPIPRRTFYRYRQSIVELFGVEIKLDVSTHEYYIDRDEDAPQGITSWLLNSAAMSELLSDSREVADRIFLEPVPSAREHLSLFIDAIKHSRRVTFTYHPFSRSTPSPGVEIEPYLLKLFRQRWYVAGRNVAENRIKTYALDRISAPEVVSVNFVMAPGFEPQEYFTHSFGIVVEQSAPRRVAIWADMRQAKYLRALPLHSSQSEMVHDRYSIFYYNLQLTQDLVRELISLGPGIKVMSPPELRTMVTTTLKDTLRQYDDDELAPTDK